MGSLAFSLRDAVPADMAAITAIYGHHVRIGVASYEEVEPSVTEITARYAATIERGLPYLVAQVTETEAEAEAEGDTGIIAAYGYVSPFRTRSAYRYTIENSVYVDERFTRQGLGRALIQALIERCTGKGYRQMVAVIGGGHRPSIAVHEVCGFIEVGRLRDIGLKHGRWLDTVLMQRPLGEGSQSLPPTQAFEQGLES